MRSFLFCHNIEKKSDALSESWARSGGRPATGELTSGGHLTFGRFERSGYKCFPKGESAKQARSMRVDRIRAEHCAPSGLQIACDIPHGPTHLLPHWPPEDWVSQPLRGTVVRARQAAEHLGASQSQVATAKPRGWLSVAERAKTCRVGRGARRRRSTCGA